MGAMRAALVDGALIVVMAAIIVATMIVSGLV
jgi:hypothetical protein